MIIDSESSDEEHPRLVHVDLIHIRSFDHGIHAGA
jgi:hypothetical protein